MHDKKFSEMSANETVLYIATLIFCGIVGYILGMVAIPVLFYLISRLLERI